MLESYAIFVALLVVHSGADDAPTVEIAPGVRMPKINLGTCCGSDPNVGLEPWFDAGGHGIDTVGGDRG
jgi:hypothetical protein